MYDGSSARGGSRSQYSALRQQVRHRTGGSMDPSRRHESEEPDGDRWPKRGQRRLGGPHARAGSRPGAPHSFPKPFASPSEWPAVRFPGSGARATPLDGSCGEAPGLYRTPSQLSPIVLHQVDPQCGWPGRPGGHPTCPGARWWRRRPSWCVGRCGERERAGRGPPAGSANLEIVADDAPTGATARQRMAVHIAPRAVGSTGWLSAPRARGVFSHVVRVWMLRGSSTGSYIQPRVLREFVAVSRPARRQAPTWPGLMPR